MNEFQHQREVLRRKYRAAVLATIKSRVHTQRAHQQHKTTWERSQELLKETREIQERIKLLLSDTPPVAFIQRAETITPLPFLTSIRK